MSTQKSKKRRGFGIFCLVLGAVLIACAAALLIHNQIEDNAGGAASAEALELLKEEIGTNKTGGSAASSIPGTYTNDDDSDMSAIEIDGYLYIGYVSLPTLGLELPVMAECDYTRLTIAPCRYFGSYKTGDLVIAGHSYKTHFRNIRNMATGDPVIFTDADGNTHNYMVDSLEMLPPSAVSEMTESGYPLTLFTCTYTGADRATVRCVEA